MVAKRVEITPEDLRRRFEYQPDTGLFIRKIHSQGLNCGIGDRAGSKTSTGYIELSIAGRRYYAHRLAYLYMTDEWPKDVVDHINGDRSDNRWENLRDVPKLENQRNMARNVNNMSGVSGVYWDRHREMWKVGIGSISAGTHRHLGFFDSFREAKAARFDGEREMGYHANHGRDKIGLADEVLPDIPIDAPAAGSSLLHSQPSHPPLIRWKRHGRSN